MDTDVHKCSDYMDDDDQGVYYQVVTGFYLLLFYRRVSYYKVIMLYGMIVALVIGEWGWRRAFLVYLADYWDSTLNASTILLTVGAYKLTQPLLYMELLLLS